jgi:hypothetical protein
MGVIGLEPTFLYVLVLLPLFKRKKNKDVIMSYKGDFRRSNKVSISYKHVIECCIQERADLI